MYGTVLGLFDLSLRGLCVCVCEREGPDRRRVG